MTITSEELLAELNKIFIRVFDRSDIVVDETTTANDIEGWDSLNHTILITEVQHHFKVKFSLKEVMKFENVGDMCTTLRAKLEG
jgi:acyl carrier protein